MAVIAPARPDAEAEALLRRYTLLGRSLDVAIIRGGRRLELGLVPAELES